MKNESKYCYTCRHGRSCCILGARYCEIDDVYVDENDCCEEWDDCYIF